MIRLLLAEDQALVRGALAALLNLEPDIEVVAEAGDGAQAWEAVKRIQPDVVVTDIEMPGMTGIDLAMRVRDSGMPTRVVIVTTFGRAG
ncbi:response regulator, partial [Lysobacter sp. 2RAB21]